MRTIIIALILAAGCSVAPGPVVQPEDFSCGNGNTVCNDGQVCWNGSCITICGTAACWQLEQDAANQCGAFSREQAVVKRQAR